MINKNFKQILKCFFTYDNTPLNILSLIGLDGTEITYNSNNFHFLNYFNRSLNTIINSDGINSDIKGGVCMGFGAGGGQVSLEDSNLETIIDNLSYQTSSIKTTEDGYIVTTSVRNNTSKDIIVSEVGVFGRGENNNYVPSDPFMLTRNVLKTPITIKPNETKTFTVTINF